MKNIEQFIPNAFLFNKKLPLNKKSCTLNNVSNKLINYKNVDFLKKYISEKGRIVPSRISNISYKKQRLLRKAIHIARYISLLPYISL